MLARPVLVIGASGKTGRAVTAALVARGVPVRAAARSESGAMRSYAAELVSPVIVDLATGRGLDAAMAGVGAVYHLAPNVHPDEVGMAQRVARSASAAGVSRFVFHSVLHPDDPSMPHHLRKAEAEEAIRALLPQATVLRPAAYHQNLLDAARLGRVDVPYSLDSPFSNVDLDDVAQVAALVLTANGNADRNAERNADGHEGATYDLAGPERLSVRELAAIATDVLGRRVDAVEIALDDWRAGPGAGLSDQARADLVAMFGAYDRGGLVGDASTLTRLLGRAPATWRDVLVRPSTEPGPLD